MTFFVVFALVIVGIVILVVAILSKKKIDYLAQIVDGLHPSEKKDAEIKQNKSKQQLEVELLMVSNSNFLRFLSLLDKNMKIKYLTVLFLSSLYYLFNRDMDLQGFALTFGVFMIIIIVLPGILTGMVLKSKVKKIMEDLPNFVDLVAVCLQVGLGLEGALKQVAFDFKVLNPDLSFIMMRILRKAEIAGMEVSLQDLVVSLPTSEIRMFCTVMQQSLSFGSSIYEQLIQLSADIREMQLLKIEEKMGTLAAKMSVPLILLIMFPIIILILAPGMMRVFPSVF
ncbi:type II secretion system F family protein [Basilea psittacipulmonis]|uniref:Pilus assembly protein TadC n=2 Tax=Basilea TaxID=1472344 RepID=A0A077DGS6_9BURK|nr:type II secretion system F family protein [Basilea psittacipulmonis]AIL32363.1 pilus assembly protein TadC [Basilea psittacipulmonis DSM 24701]